MSAFVMRRATGGSTVRGGDSLRSTTGYGAEARMAGRGQIAARSLAATAAAGDRANAQGASAAPGTRARAVE